ncbi:uncharacterized protein BDZ99DRAFT_468547 [Mytilinidion resinicola]|uniref:DUF7730 domain-containing protein n=1 Tax=Mytilinidion resinicola TaxID=574789 RepID=A0A6A6Y2U3_9PEZI|nr:uncharacterized protein BDZ99DRAFT_468547 [Mytilinidion resinicola]KAF2802853.1 hypothetical protein BDZ99DRAFT_468547 [Mytilinidion resinicola]
MFGGRCGGVIHVTIEQQIRMLDKAAPPKRSLRRRELSRPPKPGSRLPFLGKRRKQQRQTGPLFSRLPAELRIMIFSYVFHDPNDVVHVLWMRKSLAHIRCQIPEHAHGRNIGRDISRECVDYACGPSDGLYHPLHYGWKGTSRTEIALLQTCRQVYGEAINLLYSTATFDFTSARSFMYFERAILPQRLDAITSLQIYWFSYGLPTRDDREIIQIEYLPTHWDPMCRTIVTMKGLRSFILLLHGFDSLDDSHQDLLLEPLEDLRGLKECRIQAVYDNKHIYCQDNGITRLSSLGKRIMAQATLTR